MTEELTLRGFVARLQAQRTADSGSLSYAERKYLEAVEERVKKRK